MRLATLSTEEASDAAALPRKVEEAGEAPPHGLAAASSSGHALGAPSSSIACTSSSASRAPSLPDADAPSRPSVDAARKQSLEAPASTPPAASALSVSALGCRGDAKSSREFRLSSSVSIETGDTAYPFHVPSVGGLLIERRLACMERGVLGVTFAGRAHFQQDLVRGFCRQHCG